jgi:hypothetical protein
MCHSAAEEGPCGNRIAQSAGLLTRVAQTTVPPRRWRWQLKVAEAGDDPGVVFDGACCASPRRRSIESSTCA